jgi:putative colanic acid biosynthesis UDP-glucose lipid carrier transferase
MFENRSNKPNFNRAPQSITSLVAALMEPLITVLVYWAVLLSFDPTWATLELFDPLWIKLWRPDVMLSLLVIAVTLPGHNHFRGKLLPASVDIISQWLQLLGILALCGWGTNSLKFFNVQVLMWWALITPVLQIIAVRIGQLVIRRQAVKPQNRRSAIVIGGGAQGVKVAKALTAVGHDGIDFMGYIDDRADDRLHDEAVNRRLGPLSGAAAYIREHGIKEVYITLPLGSQPRIVALLEDIQGTTASIIFVPDVFGISIIQGRTEILNDVAMVRILESPFTGSNLLVKRASDIVLASLILVLIAPVLAIVAIGVRLSSPGPVIFKQRRNGLDGDEIIVYKFRSMRTMDNAAVIRQATKDDPRITPFGAFLRRSSLDELPQFVNVLQGRMSIVGPRPHAVAHNEQYRQIIKAYMVRHKVKPGITGWAQVHGHRGETDTLDKMRTRVEYDLYYLRNWSLGKDLEIIARTIKLVFFDRNAY